METQRAQHADIAALQAASEQSAIALLRLPDVRRIVGLSRTEIYRRMKATEAPFPQPVPLGGRIVAWNSVEVQRWIAQRIEAAKKAAALLAAEDRRVKARAAGLASAKAREAEKRAA